MAIASKDRTNLFENINPFIISEATGKQIANWCDSGVSELAIEVANQENGTPSSTMPQRCAIIAHRLTACSAPSPNRRVPVPLGYC